MTGRGRLVMTGLAWPGLASAWPQPCLGLALARPRHVLYKVDRKLILEAERPTASSPIQTAKSTKGNLPLVGCLDLTGDEVRPDPQPYSDRGRGQMAESEVRSGSTGPPMAGGLISTRGTALVAACMSMGTPGRVYPGTHARVPCLVP